MDGGTQGIYLVHHIRDAEILIVFDAVDYALPPGTMRLVYGDEVPKFLGAKKISLHQTGFQEVLAMAEMLGQAPREILLIGVQPVELDDFGGSLRDEVKVQIEPAIAEALRYLATFGIRPMLREAPPVVDDSFSTHSTEMTLYERGRPNEADAPRLGDGRILGSGRWEGPADFEAEIDRILSQSEEAR